MDLLLLIVGWAVAVVAGLLGLYLIFRLASYAILSSIEDFKHRRKKNGN